MNIKKDVYVWDWSVIYYESAINRTFGALYALQSFNLSLPIIYKGKLRGRYYD